jgi:hypothetical protein
LFCRFLKTGASDKRFHRVQQGQPILLERAADLDWQVRLDQDRQLLDNLPRLGPADDNLSGEVGGLDQFDGGLPSWCVRQLDEDGNFRLEPGSG